MSVHNASVASSGSGGKYPATFLVVITAICLLAPALFSSILPNSTRNFMLLEGCFLSATFMFVYHFDFDLTSLGVGFGWLLFAIVAMVSRYLAGGSFSFAQIALPLSAFAACTVTCGTRWIRPVIYFVLAMLCVHLVATFAFLAAPSLYACTVKRWFFADLAHATGYQCGLSSHYSDNAFLMAVGTILSTSLAFGAKKGGRRWFVALAILFAIGLVLTQKRAHLLFVAFAIVCLFANTGVRGKALKLLVAFIIAFSAACVAAVFIPGVSESFERLLGTFTTLESGNLEETTTGRTYLWGAAISGWLQHPLLGNGWGTFLYTWPGGNQSIYAHNELLQILHDTGVVGLAIFLSLALSSLALSGRCVKAVRAEGTDMVLLSASYFAFAFEVFALSYSFTTGGLLQQPLIYMMWFFAIAISLAARYDVAWVRKGVSDVSLRSRVFSMRGGKFFCD